MNLGMKFDSIQKGLSENFIGSRLKSGSGDKCYFTHTRTLASPDLKVSNL